MKCINKFKFVALFNLLQILDNKLFLNATITMQNYIGSIKTETKHALFFFFKSFKPDTYFINLFSYI